MKSIQEALATSRLARKLSPLAGFIGGVIGPNSADLFSLGSGIDAETPVEIGSLTKIFTALLIAEAVRRKELELSSTIDEILFGARWQGTAAISVEELATHTSGLPRLGLPFWKVFSADPYRDVSHHDLIAYLRRERPRSPAIRKFLYSNLGFAVLGLAVEKATSQPYAELLHERLCRPLGLKQTMIQSALEPDLAMPGYRADGQSAAVWHWDAYAPCGGLVSTFNDLTELLRSFLDPGSAIAEALDLATQPRFAREGGGDVGLGWMLPPSGDSFWHNGGTGGYSSYLGINKMHGWGVILLANQAVPQETTELGTSLMRLIRTETIAQPTE
jgi:CubicO group peptidase (beta-lactamase class C family)